MRAKMHRLSIELFPEQHRRIKTLASLKGQTIREYVLSKVLGKKKPKQKEFNELTKKAIEDIDKGRNLTEYEKVDDLFKKFRK